MLTPISGLGQFIHGEWTKQDGIRLESINPANGKLVWHGVQATEEDIHSAHQSAEKALPAWSMLSFEQRTAYLQQFSRNIEKKREVLAKLIALETGKPLWEANTEVNAVIQKTAISIQAFKERTWPKEQGSTEAQNILRYKPHGVVVVLGAFNFPAHLSNGHIIPALLAGNTILYKPSEHAPAVAELVMQCWQESKIPPGVINCLQGKAPCGQFLIEKPIQGIFFTGSYATGLRINQQCSNRPEVLLALEMGGNNPLVIDEVRNLPAAIYHTILSSFITAGQRCTCARRLIIPDSAFGDLFLQHLINASKKLKVGAFDEAEEPFMGPVISHEQALHHLATQQQLIALGGHSLLEMTLKVDHTGLLSPGIIDMSQVVSPGDEEIFAPLIQLTRYTHFEEAIHLANQTRYGLAAGLFSDNEQHYQQFFHAIRAGLINWNRPTTGAASTLPFGGVGLSGNHRPSAFFAADYCSYPIASMEQSILTMPEQRLPGITLEPIA